MNDKQFNKRIKELESRTASKEERELEMIWSAMARGFEKGEESAHKAIIEALGLDEKTAKGKVDK